MKQNTKEWLSSNIDIWVRQKQGNDKHLNSREREMLKEISKEIDGEDTPLSIHCFSCRQKLIKKVFEVYEEEINNEQINLDNGESIEVKVNKKSRKRTARTK